jgi:hypothetical protein
MRISLVMFWVSAGLFAMLLLFSLGTGGCGKRSARTAGKRTFDCASEIDVDAVKGVADKHEAIYVCGDAGHNQVTWVLGPGVNFFTVQFTGDCPFTSCVNISEDQPSTVKTQPNDLKVYKYTITVNGGPQHDPHVVGGGGY